MTELQKPAECPEPQQALPPSLRSGIYTTEFWQSIGSTVCGVFMCIWGGSHNNPEMMWAGVALAGGVSATYNISRGLAKRVVLT